jgi:O-antigen ligase
MTTQHSKMTVLGFIYASIVLLYPALSLSTAHGSGVLQACMLILALVSMIQFSQTKQTYQRLSGDAKLFILLFLFSVALEVFIIWVHGYNHPTLHSPVLRLVCMMLLIGIVTYSVDSKYLWTGIVMGALAVLATAFYQRFHLNIARATGYHNAIHFGNFSLALGLFAFAALSQIKHTSVAIKLALISALIAGLLTSLLSGSRGGWIAMVLSFIPLYTYSKPEYKKYLLIAMVLVISLFAVTYAIPSTGVKIRMLQIFENITAYLNGNPYTSLGYRLEMMRASLNVILLHPLIGIGDNFKVVVQEMGRLGMDVTMHNFNDTHNEVIFSFLRGGIAGFLQLILLYCAPIIYFVRTSRLKMAQSNGQLMALALAGIIFVMACIDFGLSVNIFTRQIGKSFYFIMITCLIALCEVRRYQSLLIHTPEPKP